MQPVALPPIDARLMRAVKAPACPVVARDGTYDAAELDAARRCEKAGGDEARQRLHGLQRAVRVREATTAEAVAVAKQ